MADQLLDGRTDLTLITLLESSFMKKSDATLQAIAGAIKHGRNADGKFNVIDADGQTFILEGTAEEMIAIRNVLERRKIAGEESQA